MKNWLKYILLSILALVMYDSAKADSSSTEYDHFSDIPAEYIQFLEQDSFQASPRTIICPPRQVSSVGVPRVQNSGRRNDNSGRQNFEFIKAGRVTASGMNCISRNNSQIQYFSDMESGHILVRLCRFII